MVYKIQRICDGRMFALKRVRYPYNNDFSKVYRVANIHFRLDGDWIVHLEDVMVSDDRVYLAMELMEC